MAVSLYDYNEGQSDLSILVSRVYNLQEEKSIEDQDSRKKNKNNMSNMQRHPGMRSALSDKTNYFEKSRRLVAGQNIMNRSKSSSPHRKSLTPSNLAFENIKEEDEENWASNEDATNYNEEYNNKFYDEYLRNENSRYPASLRKSRSMSPKKYQPKQALSEDSLDQLSFDYENGQSQLRYNTGSRKSAKSSHSSTSVFRNNKEQRSFKTTHRTEKRIKNYLEFNDNDDNLAKLSSSDIDDILRRISPISRKLQRRTMENDKFLPVAVEVTRPREKKLFFNDYDTDSTVSTDIYSNYNDKVCESKSSSLRTSNLSATSKKQEDVYNSYVINDFKTSDDSEILKYSLDDEDKQIALMLKNAHIGSINKHKPKNFNTDIQNTLYYNNMNIDDSDYNLIKKNYERKESKKEKKHGTKRGAQSSQFPNKPKTIFDGLSDYDNDLSEYDDNNDDNAEDSGLDNLEKHYYNINKLSCASGISAETKKIIEKMASTRISAKETNLEDGDITEKSNNYTNESDLSFPKSDLKDRKLNTGVSKSNSILQVEVDKSGRQDEQLIMKSPETVQQKHVKKISDVPVNSDVKGKSNELAKRLSAFKQAQEQDIQPLGISPNRQTRFGRYSNDKIRSTSPVRDLINKHIDQINEDNVVSVSKTTAKLINNDAPKTIIKSPKSINSIASKFENNETNFPSSPLEDKYNRFQKVLIPRPDAATAISATMAARSKPLLQSKKFNRKKDLASPENTINKNAFVKAASRKELPLSEKSNITNTQHLVINTTQIIEKEQEQKQEQESPSSPKKAISGIKCKFDNLFQRFQRKDDQTKNDSESVISSLLSPKKSNPSSKQPISPLQKNNIFDEVPDFVKVMQKNKSGNQNRSPVADRCKMFETPEEAQFKEVQRRILKNKS